MSGFIDTPMGVRAIGARTDSGGSGVTDISAEEDRFANIFVSEGYIAPADAFAPVPDASWNIDIGSGTAKTDYYVIEGQGVGQSTYLVRLDQAGDTVTIDAADLSNPRYDEIYLVVMDNAYDASGLSLPRLAVREGTPGASPTLPGPDAGWLAYAQLAQIYVPAGASDITETTVTDLRIQSQSNVDVPTLEGNVAAAFATAGHDHDATYAPLMHVGSGTGHPEAGASDGMMSAADKLKLNAIEASADVNLTPTELRTQLKTVDGSGSGLDADLLDGSSLSAFSAVGSYHDGIYYTISELNALLSNKAGRPAHVYAYRATSDVDLASAVEASPQLNAEYEDDWSGHPGSAGYIQNGVVPGYYLIEAQVEFEGHASGYRRIRIHKSGIGDQAYAKTAGLSGGNWLHAATPALIRTGETVVLWIYQNSGATLAYKKDTTWLKMTFLGETP
jgi:hypothetical protein